MTVGLTVAVVLVLMRSVLITGFGPGKDYVNEIWILPNRIVTIGTQPPGIHGGSSPVLTGVPAVEAAPAKADLARSADWEYNWDIDYPKPVFPPDWVDLLNQHATMQQEMCSGKRPLSALVVTCQQPCYAMAEGLNAFMTAFSLAVVTGRAFFINSPAHFPVETYFDLASEESLLPGERGAINWHVNDCKPLALRFTLAKVMGKDLLPASGPGSHISAIISPIIDARFNCGIMKELATNITFPEVLRVSNNLVFDCAVSLVNAYNKKHGRGEVEKQKHEPMFRSIFRRLFSFKPDTIGAVNTYLAEKNVSLDRNVCFHVRTGAFAADRDAKFKPNLNMSEFVSCALAVEKRLPTGGSSAPGPISWMLVSDKPAVSESLLQSAELLSPGRKHVLHDTEHAGIGPVRLLMESNSAGDQDDAQTRARAVKRILFDLYLMSQCRFLIAGQSGFAAMGELLGADWSRKKVFAAGERMRKGHPDAAYVNGPCRRHRPNSDQ